MSELTTVKKYVTYDVLSSAEWMRSERRAVPEEDATLTQHSLVEIPGDGKKATGGIDLISLPSAPTAFPKRESISADLIKRLNRAITKKTPAEEVKSLVDERNILVMKRTKAGLTRDEERRLTYLRWQLDRIDDAQYGEILDIFEKTAEEYERFASDIDSLLTQLGVVQKRKKSPKR